MAKLTAATVLQNPESLTPIFLDAGDELPQWAVGMVGDHILDGATEEPSPEPGDAYKGLKKDELHAEIEKRNADRPEEQRIQPESDKNDDLVAALVADDAAQA